MQTKRISEVSKSLGVSSQTVRNYLKIGPQFFSEHATKKTRKRFNDSDIEQMQTIQHLAADGMTYAEIPDHLTPAPQVVDAGQDKEPDPEPPPKQTSAIEKQYQAIIATQQHGHEREIESKNEFIEYLQDENDRLRTDLEDSRQPWYKRIFGNSPK